MTTLQHSPLVYLVGKYSTAYLVIAAHSRRSAKAAFTASRHCGQLQLMPVGNATSVFAG